MKFPNRYNQSVRVAGICLLFLIAAVLPLTGCKTQKNERGDGSGLGASSIRSQDALHEMKLLFPKLSPRSTVYIINEDPPSQALDQSSEELFKQFYKDDTLRFLFSSKGELIPTCEKDPLFMVRYSNGHLTDESRVFRSTPDQLLQYLGKLTDSRYVLKLSASDVVAGRDFYVLSIPDFANANVRIYYRLNSGPLEEFPARLDSQGKIRFEVTTNIRKGLYRFIAFRNGNNSELYKVNAVLTVR